MFHKFNTYRTDELRQQVSELMRTDNNFSKAYQQVEKEYTKKFEQAKKTYDVKFKFDRQESKYNVLINGESVQKAIERDPNALSVLQKHPDIRKYQISTAELQSGAINRTESMKGGKRPRDMLLNSTGQEVKPEKMKVQKNTTEL